MRASRVLAMPSTSSNRSGVALDDVEHPFGEGVDQPTGEVRTDALDRARAKVAANALDQGRRHDLQETRTKLQAVLAMLLPLPARLNVLARMHLGGRAEHGHKVAVPAHLHPQHAKASFSAVERYALDQA